MKIAMVIDCYDDSRNGAVISTRRFTELLKENHDVSVITTGSPAPGKVILPEFYPFGFKKVMQRMHTPMAVPSPAKLQKVIREQDIVHVQFPFLLGINTVRIARKLHVPVVSTFHIQAEHLAMNAGIHSEQFIRYCYKFWLRNLFNRSDLVICPTRFAEEELKSYGLKAPSVILSNGFPPIFRPREIERDPEMQDKFIVLSVGRFAPEKRQDLIIRAVGRSRFRDRIQLILAGEGPDQEKLRELGNTLPHRPVFYTLSQEELVRYYNLGDLYVHAATVEVEGMTVLEAMACGMPLLLAGSPKSATSQFAIDERSLFDSGNLEELVAKMDYWIEHPGERTIAKERYYQNSQKYRIERSHEKLEELYYSLVSENGSASPAMPR